MTTTQTEYTVTAHFEGEKIELITYLDLQKALDSKEESEVENDTQCFIRVYEVEVEEEAAAKKMQARHIISKKLVEIL